MSLQSGSLGQVWYGPQVEKGTEATVYYGFRGNMFDLAPQQITKNIGPMVGGSFLPGGSIKTAAFGAGAGIFPPALDDYLGWLLYAFAGSVTSNDLTTYHEHIFPSGADDTAPGKYLTGYRQVPGDTTMYEMMEDLVPARMLIGITPGEYATMRFECIGRTISSPGSKVGNFNDGKDETTVPIACKGAFEAPDASEVGLATGVTIELANMVPDLQRVLVVGDYYPYDFPVLTRGITVTATYFWETKAFYDNFFWSGTAWTPVVYSTSLDIHVESAGDIPGASVPYQLKLWASDVDWEAQPLNLVGGDLIEFQVTGTVTNAASGHDWYLRLRNGTADYTWPT